jgi:epoxyqueuosine reductase
MPVKQEIIDFASSLNIDLIHFTGVKELENEKNRFNKWIADGRNAGMNWLEHNIGKRFNPALLLDGASTVISIGVSYNTGLLPGMISRHASGKDYHRVLKEKLERIITFLKDRNPGIRAKTCVDSSVIAEKSIAARAGAGWIGKNSLLINANLGSWFFLGELIINREFEPDEPVSDMCGTCSKCIEACPTKAINSDRTIDAGKCISYWTIEDEDCRIPFDTAATYSHFAYGCDICQEACPWNRNAFITREAAFMKLNGLSSLSREELLGLSKDDFSRLRKGTAIERISYVKFMANLETNQSL